MIDKKDLRIGNWVDIFTDLNMAGKKSVRTGAIRDGAELDKKEFEGIPLTPEILEKCGFIKSETNEFYVNNALWLEATPLVTPIYCDGTGFKRYIGRHIKYVHQLQNLYYALTGEELEITL